MNRKILLFGLIASGAALASISSVKSQSPQPIVVPAATTVNTSAASSVSAPVSANPESIGAAISLLEKIKTVNEDILKRQEATLRQLDDMQQAAEELKVFSKRG
jgi:hypothetical protein